MSLPPRRWCRCIRLDPRQLGTRPPRHHRSFGRSSPPQLCERSTIPVDVIFYTGRLFVAIRTHLVRLLGAVRSAHHVIADPLQRPDTALAGEQRHHVPMLPFVTGDDPDWWQRNSATSCVNGCNNRALQKVREHYVNGFVHATRTTLRKKYERHRRTFEKQ